MSDPNNEKLLQDVTARATTDVDFRRRLLSSPEAAVYEVFGVRLPAGRSVRFIEKPAGVETLIVLPDVAAPGAELDDDDLDAAAGGTGASSNECW